MPIALRIKNFGNRNLLLKSVLVVNKPEIMTFFFFFATDHEHP